MTQSFSKELFFRSIGVIDYILEDNGHTVQEAAKEFNCAFSTINRQINIVGYVAFSDENNYFLEEAKINKEVLKKKYVKARKTLKRLGKENLIKSQQTKKDI